jgi:hypothetical protein
MSKTSNSEVFGHNNPDFKVMPKFEGDDLITDDEVTERINEIELKTGVVRGTMGNGTSFQGGQTKTVDLNYDTGYYKVISIEQAKYTELDSLLEGYVLGEDIPNVYNVELENLSSFNGGWSDDAIYVVVGPTGKEGDEGPQGLQGPQGVSGASGGILSFANFYALMPGDNTATIATGAPILFPTPGLSHGGGITPTTGESTSSFTLASKGIYEVTFHVSISEAGQLALSLNGTQIDYTVVGRATGTSQIVGIFLIQTNTPNSFIKVINPTGNPAALTLNPIAGGTHAVSAHLIIKQLTEVA